MNPAHEGRGSLFLRPRGLAACDANFFFSHGRRLSALRYEYTRGLFALHPLQGGEGGIASLDDLTKSRTHPTVSTRAAMLGKRLRRFLHFSRVPSTRDGNAPFSCPMQSRHEALHAAAKRKRAAHRNPRLCRITTDATTDTKSLRRERDAGPPPRRAARSYHARAQSIRCAMEYDVKTPRRTAMRARDMCSEAAAHTQQPPVTSHRTAEPPPQAPEGSAR